MDKDPDAADVFESVKELTVARMFCRFQRIQTLLTLKSLCHTPVCFFLQPKASIPHQ